MTPPSLLPPLCPFCGVRTILAPFEELGWTRVSCDNSKCLVGPCTGTYPTEAEAIAAFNTRPQASALSSLRPSDPREGRPQRDKTLVIRNAGWNNAGKLEGSGVPITSGAWVSLEDHKKLIAYADTLEAENLALKADNERLLGDFNVWRCTALRLGEKSDAQVDLIKKLQSPLPDKERMGRLEKLAEAAKKWQKDQPKSSITDDFDCSEAESELADAIIELDALTSQGVTQQGDGQ